MTKAEFLYYFHHARQVPQEPDYPLAKRGRDAAVLIPLLDYPNGLHLILTERAHHLRHHPGQISFPGGGYEHADNSLQDTACREAYEEIGLPRDHIEIVGTLPPYRTISGYHITPVIAFIQPHFSYHIDSNEVASVFDVPFEHLVNKANHLVHVSERNGQRFPIYFIRWRERTIWGATAAILRNLAHHLHIDP